jgi:AcrR family transcriptional regulator
VTGTVIGSSELRAEQTEGPSTRPEGPSTRQRILDTALDLFTKQGFDGTSLREIAEKLGVTKAALYYHFASKDDILMALHMRLHEFGKDALSEMAEEPITLERWGELLAEMTEQMLAQRNLFLMHERNQAALEKLHSKDHDAEHDDIQDRFRRVLADPRVSLRDRVRMACSFGAVFAGLFMSGDAFEATSTQELGGLLRHAVRDILAG